MNGGNKVFILHNFHPDLVIRVRFFRLLRVPTPNGAGPWHFAVKTVLMLYGVDGNDGAMFVLIVHTLQTALVALLGIWAAVWAIGSDKK